MSRDPAHRAEWLLMYRQGLEPADIARACHTLPRTAAAYLREQAEKDPTLLHRRLCWCLEPSLPVFRPRDAMTGWDGNALSLARFVDTHERLPRRAANTSTTEGALEVFLYHWVRAQRAASVEGGLSSRREQRLEAIPGWLILGRDQLHARHWQERLDACIDFHHRHGRTPEYRNGTTRRERTLGTWLSRQRARQHRGALPVDRAAALTAAFTRKE